MSFDSNLTEWRLVICHRNGQAMRILDNVAINRQFKFLLNRSASLSFDVPSDAEEVNGIANDGFPHIEPLDRTIRAWRKSPATGVWSLKFNGIVWQVGDATDGQQDIAHTTVTCFDPLKFLEKRLVCNADGTFDKTVRLPSADLGHTVYSMIDRSVTNYGDVYLDYSAGPWTTGTVARPPDYDQAYIAQSIIDLCDTGSMDIEIDPVFPTGNNGILGTFSAMARRGSDKPGVKFGYDVGNHAAQEWSRDMDGDTAANDITNISGDSLRFTSRAQDSTSQARFGVMQSAEVLSNIHSQDVLDDLTAWELRMRRNPQDLVGFSPQPELQPSIFDDYFLGDTVRVSSSTNVREAISGIQRVYGVTLDVHDEGNETVSELIVSSGQE